MTELAILLAYLDLLETVGIDFEILTFGKARGKWVSCLQ